MEKTKAEVLAKLKSALPQEVSFALLFGSVVQDRLQEESDVDLAVYLRSWPLEREKVLKIGRKIQDSFSREVDVIVLNSADPIIVSQVLKNGELIYVENRAEFDAFKARKTAEYIDFKTSRKIVEDNLLTKGWPTWNKKTP